MKKGVKVWSLIVILVILGSAFAAMASADISPGRETKDLRAIRTDVKASEVAAPIVSECIPCSNASSLSQVDSNWSAKPVIVNIQVNLESEEDQKYIHNILSRVESHGWITSVFVSGEFASEHPEVVREIENRGHYIGVYGWKTGEDLSRLNYNEQLDLIKKATSTVRNAVSNPKYVVDFKPQNLKYNDDTITALQDLKMKSITATFSANESFVQCPYAKSVGKVTFPYPITTDFSAVPISDVEIGSEEVLLDDEEVFSKLAIHDCLSYLEDEFDEHNETKDPMVVVISPSVTGADETKLQVLSQFLDYIDESGGKVKPTAPITVLTSFIPSLHIISAPSSASPGDTIAVTVAFSAAIYCPSYYFRIYGKYPSDAGWTLLAEHYHGVSTGTFSFSRSFAIPTPPANDTFYTVRAVGQGCAGTCWPTPNSYERMDEVTVDIVKAPEIEKIIISPKNPMTRHDVTFEAKITDVPGYEVWGVDWIVIDLASGGTDFFDIGNKNPYTHKPAAGTHGKKKVLCTIFFKNKATGATGLDQESKEFKVFFEKQGDEDGDSEPNWFEHWQKGNACPDLNKCEYDPAETGFGGYYPSLDKVKLGPLAARDNSVVTIPTLGACGGGLGIDCCYQTVAHELKHKWVADNWKAGGIWNGKIDNDGDELPDDWEDTYTYTGHKFNKTNNDTYNVHSMYPHWGDYESYGDQEALCRITENGKVVASEKDWACPGKQTDPLYDGKSEVCTAMTILMSGFGSGMHILGSSPLISNVTEQGIDSDGDGNYNNLRVTVNLTSGEAMNAQIIAKLFDSDQKMICMDRIYPEVVVGSQQVQLDLDGTEIRNSSKNGPYTLNVSFYTVEHDAFLLDSEQITTNAYSYTDFQPKNAVFSGVYTDQGIDTDGDGIYDYLTVEVETNTTIAGNYTIEGYLYSDDENAIVFASNSTYFGIGTQTVILNFEGLHIAQSKMDGPYALSYLTLFDENDTQIDFIYDAYNTSAYSYIDFQSPSAWFRDTYSDYGRDTNGDGFYENLTIDVGMNTTVAGNYTLTGGLYDSNGSEIAWASNYTYLNVGNQSMLLNFDGTAIYEHGVNGTYNLSYLVLYDENGTMTDYRSYAYTTSLYNYTDFQRGGQISGFVTDINGTPVQNVSVSASGPSSGSVTTDINGSYTISGLLSGTYDVTVSAPPEYNLLDTSATVYVTIDEATFANFTLQNGGAITGMITDYNGDPVPKAYILAIGPVTTSTITDINGGYNIMKLQGGSYTIRVEPVNPNLMTASGYVYLTTGETIVQNFTLQAAGSIAGNITDINGTGIPDIIIYLSGYETARYRTDESGYYVLPRLQAGTYTVNVDGSETDFEDNSTTIVVTLGQTTIADFVLKEFQGGSIAGRVTDVNGTGVSNARVVTSGPSYGESYTNETGYYVIPRLLVGSYTVTAYPPYGTDLASNSTFTIVNLGETTIANLILREGGKIRGKITDANGTGIYNAYVEVYPSWRYDYTNATGYYEIIGLEAGDYTVTAYPPYGTNLVSNSTTASVTLGETTTVDLVLPEAGKILGRITYENGTGIYNARVYASGPSYTSAYTNATGYYSIIGLLAGDYTVTAYPPYGINLVSNSTTATVTLGETTIVDLILPEGGVIAGKITYENGTGIYNSRVRASGPSYEDDYTNETGYYEIFGLEAGNYMVTAYPPYGTNLLSNSTTASVMLGEKTTVNLILHEAGKIVGRVTDANGTEIYNVYVEVYPGWSYDYANDTGYYEIIGLEAGNYTVTAYPPYGTNLLSNSTTATVNLGETTIVDFILRTPPDIWIYPMDFNVTLLQSGLTNRTLTIGNNGTGVLEFGLADDTLIITDPTEGTLVDIKHVYASVSSTHVNFQVETYTSITGGAYGIMWLDADQNSSTGVTEEWWPGYGLNDIGCEYAVELDPYYSEAYLYRWTDGNFEFLSDLPLSLNTYYFAFSIPLSVIVDDGNMDVSLMMEDGSIDIAPDEGHGTAGIGANWLSESPTNGTVYPHNQTEITVTINATNLEVGEYSASILINSNDPYEELVVVPVLLIVISQTCFDFDTGHPANPYSSISGTHNGTITPFCNISVSKLYTYPCPGTGGHAEYVKLWNSTGWNVTAMWDGYVEDWHNISFDSPYTLYAGTTYNYTIITGSYPQIHHNRTLQTENGWINCTGFTDTNGRTYDNWIPAVKFFW